MCEYSNDANSNLDCLDDILRLDRGKLICSSKSASEHYHQLHQQPAARDATEHDHRQDQQQGAAVGQRSGSLERESKAARRATEVKAAASDALSVAQNKLHESSPSSTIPTEQQQQQRQLSSETENRTYKKVGQMSWRDDNLITCMLITANVGTIFEESTLLELWFKQLKSYLVKIKPQLVAIHCQEVGGKNFETSMRNISNFTDQILGDETIIGDYSRVRIFLDENFQCLEKFTALGSLYLIHDSVDDVKLYNFRTAQYDLVEGKNIFAASDKDDLLAGERETSKCSTTNLQRDKLAEHVEKVKFPQELFPECRWSRKGFMRTRWLFNENQPLDLVNIHLFHDASNLVAMKHSPSPYAQTRQKALEYTLKRISVPLKVVDSGNNNNTVSSNTAQARQQFKEESSAADQVPMFIFGDFNFRLNTNGVIQRITEGVSPIVKKSSDGDEVVEIVYHKKKTSDVTKSGCDCNHQPSLKQANSDNGNESTAQNMNTQRDDSDSNHTEGDGVVMTIGKKLFDCENLDEMFRASKNTDWLLELDNELDSFRNKLHEFRISFSPSYPFKEDETGGYSYMKTRCPSWCDRILFNAAGNRIIYGKNFENNTKLDAALDQKRRIELLQSQGDVIYRLMGNSVPMGDHKPVLLYCQLRLSPRKQPLKCNVTGSAITESTTSGLVQSTAM